VVITTGTQHALSIAAHLLLDPGEAAWMEDPGYPGAAAALAAAGAALVHVAVDRDGLDVAAGTLLAPAARVAYVSPSHQYPLGVTMTLARRLELLRWANAGQSWIFEDDYDSEFRYDSMPIASLQGLDRNAHVIYVGTFSKVMFPSLRLGYLVAPRHLVERFAAMRQATDICPADLTQAVAAEFIREGHFARHIRRMRPVYAERRRALVAAIGDELGNRVSLSGDEAGMHLALTIESLRNDQKIATKAAQESLWLSPLSQSYVGKIRRQGFVLGFGNTSLAQIVPAVRHLKAMLSRKSEHLKL